MPAAPLTDDEAKATVAAYFEHDQHKQNAADALGLHVSTFNARLRTAFRRAARGDWGTNPVIAGFVLKTVSTQRGPDGEVQREWIKQGPEAGDEFEVPADHAIKGVSALVGPDGRVIQQWIKTRQGSLSIDETVRIIKDAFADYKGRARPVKPPAKLASGLLTLIPCNDWHINLLTWEREVGQNWDLKIAENVIGDSVEDAIARSPASEVGVVLGGGDLVHADSKLNQTTAGTPQDVDSRYAKGLEVASRLMVRTVDVALARHERVVVRILAGNHDEHTSVAVAYFLLAWYRNEPRVTIDVDASLFWWFRFGLCMFGATHGHTVKIKDMPQIMASRRAADWGASKFRYIHGFHLHHSAQFATEGGGCVSEIHQAPIPQDAWHYGSGFLSGRSVKTITYHKDYGEISRVRVAILDAA